ncbi:hypothetical protein D9M68_790540 [compost metagenome]
MQHAHRQADGAGLLRIEDEQQEIAPFGENDCGDHQRDQPGLDQVGGADAEDIAEQDMIEMHVGLDRRVEHDAEAKQAGKHHAHHRIFLDAGVFFEVANREGAAHAGGKGADAQWNADDIGQHHPGQHCVGDGVAHQRPALEHQKAGQQSRGDRHHDGDRHG